MKTARWRRAVAVAAALTLVGIVLVTTSSPASAAKPLARATLVNAAGVTIGEVVFKGPGTYADRVEVEILASTVPRPGAFHGFHVHTTGICDPTPVGSPPVVFGSAGGHWNPSAASHGAHKGDLPSVLITADGETYAEFETDRFNVTDLLAGDGSAVVLHEGADNFANIPVVPYGGPQGSTLNTGDAGSRYACGVVRAA